MTVGKLITATPVGAAILALEWDDGRRARVDLADVIAEHRPLAPLANSALFDAVRVSDDGWSLEWPNGLDFGAPQLRRWADEQAGLTMSPQAFRAWLTGHSLTQDAAAEALGLSRRTIAYYLSGEQPVPKTVMLATEGYDQRRAA